mgnify:CR=1 FL=1
MSTKIRFLFFLSLIVIASLVITACGAVASPSEAQVVCGELGVKSYTKEGFECNSSSPATESPAATQQVVPTASQTSTPIPTAVLAPANTCYGGATIVSQSTDWTVVVVEQNGRIWQPCLLDGSIRPTFTTTFTAPATGSYTFNGVNASLQESGKVLAENVNGKVISLVQGHTYTVVNGKTNGGFELVPTAK